MIEHALNSFGLSRIKLILGGAIAASIITAIGMTTWYVSSLKDDLSKSISKTMMLESNNKILQANIDVLHQNMETLTAANQANVDTIQKLLDERAGAQQVISNLANMTAKDKQTIADLNGRLDELAKDPRNDGMLSPALRETIRGVQQSRKQK